MVTKTIEKQKQIPFSGFFGHKYCKTNIVGTIKKLLLATAGSFWYLGHTMFVYLVQGLLHREQADIHREEEQMVIIRIRFRNLNLPNVTQKPGYCGCNFNACIY